MKDNEIVSKFTISLEKDLFDWVEAQVIAINKKDRRAKSSRSAVIAHAVQAMKESEEGKAQPVVGVVIRPSLREFRFWALNSYEEELPQGWVGQVHDLTNQPYCGGVFLVFNKQTPADQHRYWL